MDEYMQSDGRRRETAILFPWGDASFSRELGMDEAREGTNSNSGQLEAFVNIVKEGLVRNYLHPPGGTAGAERILARLRKRILREFGEPFGRQETDYLDEVHFGGVDSAESTEQMPIEEKQYSKDLQDADFEAFQRMLPELLKEHRGEYALIINRELVRIDRDEFALLKYAYSEHPDCDGLIQPIQEKPPVIEMGGAVFLAG